MRRFLFFVMALLPLSIFAQAITESDSHTVTPEAHIFATFVKSFDHGLSLTIEEEIRSAPSHRAHTTLGLTYSPISYLSIYAAYTLKLYGDQGWTDVEKYLRHRANLLVTGQVKLGQWSLSLREGVMLDARCDEVDSREKNAVDFTLRSRLQAMYSIPETPLGIVGKFEVLNTLNAPVAYLNSIANSQSPIANSQSPIAKKWSIIAAATASGRQVYYRDQETFLVGSMHAAAYWHAHTIFHLGGGVDVFYDGAYIPRDTQFQKTNLAAAKAGDCWRIGVSLQPTFVVGDFSLGLHLGAYLYDPVKELEPYSEAILSPTGRLDKPMFYAYDLLKAGSSGNPDGWLYTSVVLRYHLPWHIFLQAMMKSHLTKVEFVSLGIGFYY